MIYYETSSNEIPKQQNLPSYRRITGKEAPGSDKDRLEMMELEAEEMLFTGDMKEKLWVKSLDKNQYKQLMDEESQARKETLDKMIRAWEEA